MKNSFVLYTKYSENLRTLTDEQKGKLFQLIFDYMLSGTTQTGDPTVDIAFGFIKTQLDDDNAKYAKQCETNRENINKRWKKYKSIQHDTTEYDRTFSNYDNDNDNDNDLLVIVNVPKLEEIKEFCRGEKLIVVNPEEFFNYYSKKKWIINGKPMQDWKKIIKLWNSNPKVKKAGFAQREYDYAELEKEILAN